MLGTDNFWPTLPIHIPPSQGVPLWWVTGWWAFQVVAMLAIIYVVTRWALRIDRLLEEAPDRKEQTFTQGPGSSVDS